MRVTPACEYGCVFERIGSRMRAFFVLPVLAVATSSPIAAQKNQPGHAWFGAGFGYGGLHLRCDHCSRAGGGPAAGYLLAAGLVLSPSWRVGMEVDTDTRETVGDQFASLTAVAVYAPFGREGFFLKAGVGGSRYDSQTPDGPNEEGDGWAVLAGAGYGLRLSSSVGVTPTFTVRHSRVGEIGFHHLLTGRGVEETSYVLSLGITLY